MTRPLNTRPEDRIPIQAMRAIDTVFARVYHRLTIVRPAQLPRRGAGILVCNHVSSVDPLLLQSASPQRLVIWMMAKEYMHLPVLSWCFKQLGVIPVDRGGHDSSSLRAALRSLKDGRVLGVFPEGRIGHGDGHGGPDDLLPFHTGAALMAIKANVPVYPAYQDGTQRGRDMFAACLHRQQAAVAFGPPVQFDRSSTSRENLDAATAAIRDAVARLGDDVRAGRHFPPPPRRRKPVAGSAVPTGAAAGVPSAGPQPGAPMPDPTKQKDDVTRAPESGDRDTSGPPGTRSAEPKAETGPVSPGQPDVGEDFESGNPAPK